VAQLSDNGGDQKRGKNRKGEGWRHCLAKRGETIEADRKGKGRREKAAADEVITPSTRGKFSKGQVGPKRRPRKKGCKGSKENSSEIAPRSASEGDSAAMLKEESGFGLRSEVQRGNGRPKHGAFRHRDSRKRPTK